MAEDGSMVRVLSNSPIGFGGIHLDGSSLPLSSPFLLPHFHSPIPYRWLAFNTAGIVSRVFDVWKEGTEQQCFRDRSIAKYHWYCDQERFLISAPTWPGASGSPVIAATVRTLALPASTLFLLPVPYIF